jgi:hypothetical protein
MKRRESKGSHLGYYTHYVVDGGKARIMLNALVTPFEVTENQPMLDLLWRTSFRWLIHPRQVTGDTAYGTVENISAVERAGIRAYVPPTSNVSGSPTISERISRRRGSILSAATSSPADGTRRGAAPRHRGQVREKPLRVAQERALALYAPQLLEEGEGDDFRVGKPLEGLVVSSAGIEMGVSVVYEAEEDGQSRIGPVRWTSLL